VRQVQVRAELLQCGQTDMTKLSHFSQFCNTDSSK